MMTEKYPTWLTGHVKEWAQKRLPTVTLCSTTGSELLGPACTLKGGYATYEVEGNQFIGNPDTTGDLANQYAPVKVTIGANVNSDTTKTYAANTCNYDAIQGKYAEVVKCTPKQPDTITRSTGYLGQIKGLCYRMQAEATR